MIGPFTTNDLHFVREVHYRYFAKPSADKRLREMFEVELTELEAEDKARGGDGQRKSTVDAAKEMEDDGAKPPREVRQRMVNRQSRILNSGISSLCQPELEEHWRDEEIVSLDANWNHWWVRMRELLLDLVKEKGTANAEEGKTERGITYEVERLIQMESMNGELGGEEELGRDGGDQEGEDEGELDECDEFEDADGDHSDTSATVDGALHGPLDEDNIFY